MLSVATATEGFTGVVMILPAIAFHAVCAVAGVQMVAAAKRRTTPVTAEVAEAAQA